MNRHLALYSVLIAGIAFGPVGQASAKKKEIQSEQKPEAAFTAEPLIIKGSGSCEGVEVADLDKDGLLDIISGTPMNGYLTFYKNTGTNYKPAFADKVFLSNSENKMPIKTHHW